MALSFRDKYIPYYGRKKGDVSYDKNKESNFSGGIVCDYWRFGLSHQSSEIQIRQRRGPTASLFVRDKYRLLYERIRTYLKEELLC